YQKITRYVGGYEKFLEQREANYLQQLKDYEHQQEEVRRAEDFIQRNIARASTTKRAQSKRKQLGKMKLIDKPKGEETSARFSFEIQRRSGNDVLKANNVSFHYEDAKPLFSNVNI